MPAVVNIKSTRNISSAVGYASGYNGKAKAHNGYDMKRVLYASGVNCDPKNGLKQMMDRVKRKQFLQTLKPQSHRKIVQGYTLIQSFDKSFDYKNPDDVKKVNALGQKLVEKVVPGKLALVYTQADGTHHMLHNHIIVCSLSANLRAMHGKQTNFRTWANASDKLLQEEGLETLAPVGSKTTAKEKITRAEIGAMQKGVKTRTELIKERIEEIEQDPNVIDWNSFVEVAKKHDLDVHVRRNKKGLVNGLSYKLLNTSMKRGIRARRLGSNYMKENLNDIFETNIKRRRLAKQREERIRSGIAENATSTIASTEFQSGTSLSANLRFTELDKKQQASERHDTTIKSVRKQINSEFRRAITPSNKPASKVTKQSSLDFFEFTRHFGNNKQKHRKFDEALRQFVSYKHDIDKIRAVQSKQRQRADDLFLLSRVRLDRQLKATAKYKSHDIKRVERKQAQKVIQPTPKPQLITKFGYTLKREYSDYADILTNQDYADMQYILHPEWFVKPEKPEQSANPKPPTPQKQQGQNIDDGWNL